MITVDELDAAIAECIGQPKPNANTCIKLAAYYIIRDELSGEVQGKQSYSFDAQSNTNKQTVVTDIDTDFARRINGKTVDDVVNLFDDLMSTLHVINPRLYDAVMRKL